MNEPGYEAWRQESHDKSAMARHSTPDEYRDDEDQFGEELERVVKASMDRMVQEALRVEVEEVEAEEMVMGVA